MAVCYMTWSKVTDVQNLWKWPISKSISSANIDVIKRLTMDYYTLRQYLNFQGTFLIFVFVWCHVTFKLRVFHLWRRHSASMRSRLALPYAGYSLLLCIIIQFGSCYQTVTSQRTLLLLHVILLCLQHAILFAKVMLSYLIPDRPEWVETAVSAVQYQSKLAYKRQVPTYSPLLSNCLTPTVAISVQL